MLLGSGLCNEPIPHLEESYRLWCVIACVLETSGKSARWAVALESNIVLAIVVFFNELRLQPYLKNAVRISWTFSSTKSSSQITGVIWRSLHTPHFFFTRLNSTKQSTPDISVNKRSPHSRACLCRGPFLRRITRFCLHVSKT